MSFSAPGNFRRFRSDNVLPVGILEWMLAVFILGLFTVSYMSGLSIVMVIFGALMTGLFLVYFLYQRISLDLPPEVIAYFCWILWSLGGLVNAIDPRLFFHQFTTIIQMAFLIFMVTVIIILKKKISTVMLLVGIGGISVAFSAFFAGGYRDNRATGYLENANEFAYAILYALFAVAYFWGRKKTVWWRFFLAGLILLSFVSILLSGSRKGFLSAVLFLFLWWLFSQSRASMKKSLNKAIILLFLAGAVYIATDIMMPYTPLGKRFADREVEHGLGRRLTMYQEGFEIIKKHPFFGIGLDNYRKLSSTLQYSHSDSIEVASTTGLIGFIFYYSIYVLLWLRLRRLKIIIADRNISDTIIVLRVAIILILMAGLGTVHIKSKITWLFLASSIGYSWSLEQAVNAYRRKLIDAEEKIVFPDAHKF